MPLNQKSIRYAQYVTLHTLRSMKERTVVPIASCGHLKTTINQLVISAQLNRDALDKMSWLNISFFSFPVFLPHKFFVQLTDCGPGNMIDKFDFFGLFIG